MRLFKIENARIGVRPMVRAKPWLAGALWLGAITASSWSGCATGPASPAVRHAAVRVALIDGMPMPPSRRLRQVEAISCARELGHEPVIADAREGLRLEAARVGANAVANIMCDVVLASARSECWKVARCTGDAACVSRSTNPQVEAPCD